ncbi:hypothetical protein OIDMADRAFT_147592 [Oidiodendron maius Zn]|uniref:Uncharacterized protein n=1 Tax=Oidiodendron maius (strain Zn) TaxID=913774 RepID=A0A0C3H454_OIDMZ|nr:hypothetical protein OIDMADRAFT_147592 [Oidiodendron maius Zn]
MTEELLTTCRMTPEFLIDALSTQDIPPLEDAEGEAKLRDICQELMDLMVALLKAHEISLRPDNKMVMEEISAIHLQIGTKLSESLLATFPDQLGTVGPRLSKLVFDELTARGFDNIELENVVRGLMQALEPALLVEDSEGAEYTSDDFDEEEEVLDEDAEKDRLITS